MENCKEFREELANLVERLQEKQEFICSELDSIQELIAMLCQMATFLDGDAVSAAEKVFEKRDNGAHLLNLLGDIRNTFITQGYDAAVKDCFIRFSRLKEQLQEELELPKAKEATPAYDVAKFQEIKSFFGLKTDDATLKMLVNMAHAELDES